MTLAITFILTPNAQACTAIAAELRRDQKLENVKALSRTRRTTYDSIIGGTGQSVTIVFSEPKSKLKPKIHPGPPKKSKPSDNMPAAVKPFLCVTANPAEILIGRRALSSECLVAQVGAFQLDLCKKNLRPMFPSLDESVVESITADHCQLQSIRLGIYFKFDSEAMARKALFDLDRQAKITRGNLFDFSVKSAKLDVGVVPDECNHHGITISLPFGHAHASVRRQSNESPAVYSKTVSNVVIHAAMRFLLCVEVEVDLGKFSVAKSNGLTFKFPRDYQMWTKENLPNNPLEIVWNEVLKALRLDVPLATTESAVNLDGLDWMQWQVAEAYLEGKYLRALEGMPKDSKEILAMREVLASTANVDIFIPFVIAKLNLSKNLGPKLAFEKRFDPGADEVLGHCTLSKKTLAEAKSKIDKKLDGNAWIIQRPK